MRIPLRNNSHGIRLQYQHQECLVVYFERVTSHSLYLRITTARIPAHCTCIIQISTTLVFHAQFRNFFSIYIS